MVAADPRGPLCRTTPRHRRGEPGQGGLSAARRRDWARGALRYAADALVARQPDAPTPTRDLYFADAFISEPTLGDGVEARAVGGNAFEVARGGDRAFVVLRRCAPSRVRDLERARASRSHRIAYLLDDDVWAMVRDAAMPLGYRLRIAAQVVAVVEPVIRLADVVAVASDTLGRVVRRRFPGANVVRIDPACPPLPSLDHHAGDVPLRLVLADTRSHDGDASRIAEPLAEFMRATPSARLVTFLGDRAPASLRLPNAEHRQPLPWPAFRAWRRNERFHVLLAPRADTAVNRARSVTRLLDAAGFGAVGLYGHNDAIREAVARGGLPAPTAPVLDWRSALEGLARRRDRLGTLAERTADVAAGLGDVERQRALWLSCLWPDRPSSLDKPATAHHNGDGPNVTEG